MPHKGATFLYLANVLALILTFFLMLYLALIIPETSTIYARGEWMQQQLERVTTPDKLKTFADNMARSLSRTQSITLFVLRITLFWLLVLLMLLLANAIYIRRRRVEQSRKEAL